MLEIQPDSLLHLHLQLNRKGGGLSQSESVFSFSSGIVTGVASVVDPGSN
jgi:hypothetical protein